MNEAQISPKVSMFKADEASPINYARVVILGDVGVGKTALVKVISVFSLILKIFKALSSVGIICQPSTESGPSILSSFPTYI